MCTLKIDIFFARFIFVVAYLLFTCILGPEGVRPFFGYVFFFVPSCILFFFSSSPPQPVFSSFFSLTFFLFSTPYPSHSPVGRIIQPPEQEEGKYPRRVGEDKRKERGKEDKTRKKRG
jgi:hypothetical protein